MAKTKKSTRKVGKNRAPASAKRAKRDQPRPLIGILTGSPNDLPVVLKARETLDALGVPNDVRVLSAHRTPVETVSYVTQASSRGIEVLIACAGMAAHLAGVVAAHTTLPVIGVPLASKQLDGLDALLATVQMPPGIPVATVAIDGSKNAALLAARILATTRPALRRKLEEALAKDRQRYDSPDVSVPSQADEQRY